MSATDLAAVGANSTHGSNLDAPELELWTVGDDRIALGLLGHPELADLPSARDRAEHRVRLAPWLSAPMLATESSQRRVAQWVQCGGLAKPPETRARIRRQIEDGLWALGDQMVAREARATLATLPQMLIADAIANAVVLCTSESGTAGMLTQWPCPARGPDEEAWSVLLITGRHDRPEAVRSLVAHEAAHFALEPRERVRDLVPAPDTRSKARRQARVLARKWNITLPQDPDPDAPFRAAARAERLACRLAESWGFTGISEQACVRLNVSSLARELGPRGLR